MLRTAVRPRWLALLALALLAATVMSLLGRWQWERSRVQPPDPARAAGPAVAVQQVLPARSTFPKAAVGRRVLVEGRWDGSARLLVRERPQQGRIGYWVLAPVVLADGTAVPVVRGWVTDPQQAAAQVPQDWPDGARVQVQGLLQPGEPAVQHAPGAAPELPADQVERVAPSDLVTRWPYPLTTGFVVLQQERSAPADASGAVWAPVTGPLPALVPPPPVPQQVDWRNVAYAGQWWLFAVGALALWWRLVRDDHLARRPVARGGLL